MLKGLRARPCKARTMNQPGLYTVLLAEDSGCSNKVRPGVIHSVPSPVLNTSFLGEVFAQFNVTCAAGKFHQAVNLKALVCSIMKAAHDQTSPGKVYPGGHV